MLRCTSIRKGFACNSSSSHYCVIFSDQAYPQVYPRTANGSYGWDDFVLKDEEVLDYFNAMFSDPDLSTDDSYVDHQSRYYLFNDEDFKSRFLQEVSLIKNIVVFGGNDNTSRTAFDLYSHLPHVGLTESIGILGWLLSKLDTDCTIRWLKISPDEYTFINHIGDKYRFSFKGEDYEIKHSPVPELVDLKITDYCKFGCKYCYQGSTAAGDHAPLEQIKDILVELSNLGTLEVALGGGEPTLHPHFNHIVNFGKELGLLMNTTTRNIKNLQELRKLTADCNAVAISVNDAVSISTEDLIKLGRKFSLQAVVGTVTKENALELIELSKSKRVTWLGYKSISFGENYKPLDDSWVEDLFKCSELYCDSAFISQYESLFEKYNIDPVFTNGKEGAFSCYIDALTCKLYKDSYSTNKSYSLKNGIKSSYIKMQIDERIRESVL